MLEEFKKMILRGSLSSCIIINNLNSNFSSISYKKCRRLTRGIWLFVGGWKLKQFFTRMRGCFCNMYCHVTISAWRRQFVLLSLITNSEITKKSDYCIFLFFSLSFCLFFLPFFSFLITSVLFITISYFYFFPIKKGTMLNIQEGFHFQVHRF